MAKATVEQARDKMDKAVQFLRSELKGVRTGRANTSLFDNIKVDAYGTLTPLNGVGTVHVVDAHMITIQPWDTSLIQSVEKAIMTSGLGLNPSNDGKLIRIPIPQLTEERRKELVKLVKKMAEEAKVVVRNERRDANDKIKKIEKEKTISEDEAKRYVDDVQKLTDNFIKEIDDVYATKEKELMAI